MLGIDLYKGVLLNGEKYKDKNGEIYYIGNTINNDYSIYRNKDNASMINMTLLERGCKDIHNFMRSELEELKQEIEMKWYECIEKYAENMNKYYIKVYDETSKNIYEYISPSMVDDSGNALTVYEIKNCKWYLCEV